MCYNNAERTDYMKKLCAAFITVSYILSSPVSAQIQPINCVADTKTEAMFTSGLKIEPMQEFSFFSLRSVITQANTDIPLEEYLRGEIKKRNEIIDISAYNITFSYLDGIYNKFILCNSDLPVLTGCKVNSDNGFVTAISPYYIYETKEESDKKYLALDALTDEIASVAQKGKTETEKALFAFDKIVIDYDYTPGNEDEFTSKHRTAYSFLDDGVGVCQGYAILYKLVLDKLGIENYLCANDQTDVNHAWSYIKLDGMWYHSDATYGEFTNDRTAVNHKYFLMNDTEMAAVTHHGVKADWEIQSTDITSVDCSDNKYSSGYLFNHLTAPFARDKQSVVFTQKFNLHENESIALDFRTSDLIAMDTLISEPTNDYVYVFTLNTVGKLRLLVAAYEPDGRYRNGTLGGISDIAENSIIPIPVAYVIPDGVRTGDYLKFMALAADCITPIGNYTTVK